MWIWLLIIASLLWIANFLIQWMKMCVMASRLPACKTEIPILGIAHLMVGNSESIMDQLKDYSYQAMEHNGLLRVWCFHLLIFVMINPVDLEYILKMCMEKSDLHKISRSIIGNGGIFAPVAIWRRRRKVMVPTFSPKIVDSFVSVFSQQSEKMVGLLESHADRGPVGLWSFLSSYTLDSVCETTMGVKINAQENPNTIILVAMNTLLDLVCRRFFHVWLQPEWLWKLFPQYRVVKRYTKIMYDFADEVINKRKKEIEKEKQTGYDNPDQKTRTFLDHLISLSEISGEAGFTNRELREEILTLVVAGTDTSAVATGYTMLLMAKYPHLQEKAYEEVYSVFGDSDRPLVKEDLVQLKYLERFVKESLRLFPPVPISLRKVENDLTLPSGRVLPKGGTIMISMWGAHRDPKYWGPDAEVFDPDRFLPERFNISHACCYMPFSQGPRNCVGYQYALMSIKTAVSALLRKYIIVGEVETSPVPKIRVKIDIMMKSVDDYTVSLKRRKPVIGIGNED